MVSACRLRTASGAASGTGTERAGLAGGERLVDRLQPAVLGDRLGVAGLRLLADPARAGARPARSRRGSARSRSSRCRRAGRRGRRGAARRSPRGSGRRGRSRRSRGSRRGTGCRAPPLREAPLTRPAMSWKSIVAGSSSELRTVSATASSRSSGTWAIGDVGLDRRERVVAGLGAALGQGVEEGRLAGVRQPDDPDLHRAPPLIARAARSGPATTPSTAPARTSDG